MIEDFIVFSDLHNPNLKYYAPGNLKLKTKLTGEPDFILTQLRYTGVSLYGNQGEKRFTNIIQMNIEMERMDPINLEKLRNQFHFSPQIKWVPLAIQNLESTLIYSASSLESKDDQNLKKTNGFFQGGSNTGGVFWTERNFTIALDNVDAQLIEDQIQNNRLAFSFTYAFYAEVILSSYKDLTLKGDMEFKKNFLSASSDVMSPDTIPAQMAIKTNSFSISIDINQFPNCIRKVDINQEQTPPAYAYVEVRCLDFNNKIRDDLFFKTFELEAQGVNGEPVTGELKFYASRPDEHTMTVKFPFAVKMNKPPRYRVIETNDSGERLTLPWTNLNAWKPMIDITTNLDQLGIKESNLDIEIDAGWIEKNKTERVEVWTRYYFMQKPRVQMVSFNSNEMNDLKIMKLRYDRHSILQYKIEIAGQAPQSMSTWHDVTNEYLLIK